MTKCRAKTSRCSHCTPSTEANNAANAPGISADATSACAHSRKVLRGRPRAVANARSLCPAARHSTAAVSACARSKRVAGFIERRLAKRLQLD
jgi:hypothetical protein